MRIYWPIIILLIVVTMVTGCFTIENTYTVIPPGRWRAQLELVPTDIPIQTGKRTKDKVVQSIDEVTEGILPFNFEVTYTDEQSFYIDIINGPEKIRIDDIEIWHDNATNNDSILINFPVYGTYIKAGYEEDKIQGQWFVPYRGAEYKVPFRAEHGEGYRFSQLKKEPKSDLSGKWQTTFSIEDDPYPAIGEFVQEGNHLSGTFMTETGDYRYLEGTVQADKAYLSCFDGSHAFLFEAKIIEKDSLVGSFRSGSHYKTIWSAIRNNDYVLGNPDSLTYLKEGYDRISFELENTKGELVSLENPEFQNKIKIVQILGTWCPNCRDETQFLVDYLKENPSDHLEIIAVAFERYRDKEKNMLALKNYKENFQMDYDILYGGYFNKKEAAETFPMLNHILSYPTMIFIDRNNKVRRIHTGFSGPATSVYKPFVEDFNSFVDQLINEEENQLN